MVLPSLKKDEIIKCWFLCRKMYNFIQKNKNFKMATAKTNNFKHFRKAEIMMTSLARSWQGKWMDYCVLLNWESNVRSEVLLDIPDIHMIWWQACRKQCGMAAVAAPKICRERERKGREERKGKEEKEKRGEKGKKRREQERKMYYACGCKTPPHNCQKIIKDTKRGRAEKKIKK